MYLCNYRLLFVIYLPYLSSIIGGLKLRCILNFFWPQYLAAAGRSVGVVLVKEDVKQIIFTQTWVGKLPKTENLS